MKYLFQIIILMTATGLLGQTNLVDDSTWTVGTGGVSGFSLIYGNPTENERLMGTDPHGANSLLWAAVPEGSPTNSQDGGWRTDWQNIDPNKTYRFTVWMKKTGSVSGLSYLGLNALDGSGNKMVLTFAGNTQNNPYFWWGDLPELNKWYLIIGYIHNSSYTGANLGEMYDGSTGQKVTGVTVTDFKFDPNATRFRHRVLLFADSNANDRQYYWAPTIYEVNGQEPTIQELLNPNGGGTGGQWSTHTDGIYYDSGDVAIGTTPAFNSKLYVRDATTDGGTGLFSWASTSHTGGNVASVKGAWLLSLNHSTGILDESIGANVGAGNETSGTGTVDKAYGVLVDVQDGAGTINDGYGLYIKRVNGTNPYGIYQVESTIENYFAGNVGIGTTAISGWELAVGGKIRAEEVKVETGWADYVFKDDYQLPSLEEVEKHIAEKGHLINIPSAAEVEANGILLGEMNKLLLEKIEELTLYVIEENKAIEQLSAQLKKLKEESGKK